MKCRHPTGGHCGQEMHCEKAHSGHRRCRISRFPSVRALSIPEPEISAIWKQKRKQTLVWLSNRKSQKDPGWRDGGANRFFSGFSVAF